MEDQWTLEGTSRLNTTGGSGTFTVPKHIAEYLLEERGQDYAVFVNGDDILIKPKSEVTA